MEDKHVPRGSGEGFEPTGRCVEADLDNERLLEILATGVAHSFNNVMASVRAALQVARDRLGPDCLPPELRSIDMVLSRGSTLTRSLLTLAHARQGRARPLYLLDVVEDTLELLEPGLQLQNITVSRCYSRAPVIQAPRAAVQRAVLRTMLLAAATIDPLYPEIRIGFGRGEMPFLEFFWTRAPSAPSGLEDLRPLFRTVQQTVEKCGGRLTLQVSAHAGTGVELHFVPSIREGQPVAVRKKEVPVMCRALSVLLIDDEAVLRRMVASYLTLHGMQVQIAEDGPRGLTLAETRSFDVVLLDLVMPGMGGEQVLEQLRARRPSLPVVVLSALLDDTLAESLLASGAYGVVAKPLQLDRLLWICRDAVAARAAGTFPDQTRKAAV